MKNRTCPRPQNGVSLIELMAGLAIGLLVVVAAIASLASTRAASRVMGDSTRLQQDAATAFRIIGSVARQAGARRLQNTPESGQVIFNPQYAGYGAMPDTGHPLSIKGTDGVSNGPDTLEIRRDRGSSENESVDCLGEATVEEKDKKAKKDEQSTEKQEPEVTSAFSVVAGLLSCDGSGPSKGAYGLVSGVEDFQVWYGLREGNGLRYATASELNEVTPAPWDQIEAVRICLRLAGELSNQPGAAVADCHGETIKGDGRLRRVFSRVFKLRNAGP